MIDITQISEEDRGELARSLMAQELQALAETTDKARINQLEDSIAALSAVLHRRNLAAVLGQSYNGVRDLYEALGYPKELTAEVLAGKYWRNEIAGRIVDLPANAAWKRPPIVTDGGEAAKKPSAFIEELKWLVDHKQLWAVLNDFDRKLGIGNFGIVVIGVDKSGKLETELSKGGKRGAKAITYLRPFPHDAVSRIEYEESEDSPRFGLPVYYTVNMGTVGNRSIGDRRVHYTRVLHAAENAPGDQVMGRSRLERPYNRLEDLDRVIGASSESVWRLAIKGTVISGKEGYKELDPIADELKSKNEAFIHGLERTLILSGADYQQLGGEMVDPSGLFAALGTLIAAGADIPKRILFGSEEAQLAGDADQENWSGQVNTRRENFINPAIIRRFIDWAIEFNILPPPTGGAYSIHWPSNFEQRDEDKAATKQAAANALSTAQAARINGANLTDQEVRAFGLLPPEPIEGQSVAANNDKAMAAIRWLMAAMIKQEGGGTAAKRTGKGRPRTNNAPIQFPTTDEPPTDEEIIQAIEDWDRDFPELAGLIDAIFQPKP